LRFCNGGSSLSKLHRLRVTQAFQLANISASGKGRGATVLLKRLVRAHVTGVQ